MPHDPRLVKDEDNIEQLRSTIPEWIKKLQRPKTPCVTPAFGPLEGIRAVSTYGQYGKQEYLGRPGYDAIAQAYGGMMNLTGDPAGPPQRAKSYTGDYVTALTGWASTMMALWEVKKSGRGQVIDLAQYEAVAQTNGNTLPLFTGQGV